MTPGGLPALLEEMRNRLPRAAHVLVALDFDGTLAPIVTRPEDACMLPETAGMVRNLIQSGQCTVAIVSGRSVSDLKARVRGDLYYAGNHGLEIEGPGIAFLHSEANALRELIDHASWDLEAAFLTVRGVFVERKGLSTTVHYRQAPAELTGWVGASVAMITRPYGSQIMTALARKAWEIRPRVEWNKGSAVQFLLDRVPAACSLLVCAGDDHTDEDMFARFPKAVSIKVGGSKQTRARYRVNGIGELVTCLGELHLAHPALAGR